MMLFFPFDLFIILPSLQVINCGKNTVQENEIYSESNVFSILENRTVNRQLVLNRVEQGMFAPLIMAALDLQIIVCR